MKKILTLLLSLSLVLGLAACGTNTADNTSSSAPTETPAASESETTPESDEALSETESGAPTEEPTESAGGKTLVVYFSATGNTEEVANYIVAATGADVFELEPVNGYTDADLNYNDDNSRVVREHDNPDEQNIELVATTVENWDEYDTIFIGYPIWWHIAAWPINGFVEANDFADKTVIPFCTSGSSDLGESGELLAEMAGTGEWLEGRRFSSRVSESDVSAWIDELGLPSGSEAMTQNRQISITMGETTIYADLYDTELADEFLAQLPQTISMQRVGGGREFYGSLGNSLNYNEEDSQTTFENGDIAYWYSGNGLCLLYDNQVEEPEIDSGIIVFGKITSDLSVFSELDDNIEVRVEVYAE